MHKHIAKAIAFEQESVRLPNGDYHPEAPQLLQEFWLKLGLYMELEPTFGGMLVKHMCCVEDVS